MKSDYDVIVIGGGAAGMMVASVAGRRGRSVLLIEHGKALGEKIRISGGGRCNFTNLDASPKRFISSNPHFCISALKRFSAADFIRLVEAYQIPFHEKKLGQLFCDHSSRDIIAMLEAEMALGKVDVALGTKVSDIAHGEGGFHLTLAPGLERGLIEGGCGQLRAPAVVIATGGKSIPKMGASGFGYQVAGQFGVPVIEPRPGLVPLTYDEKTLLRLSPLAGIGVEARVEFEGAAFEEALLFTHRGLSGPAILQISSFWREGQGLHISLLPGVDFDSWLQTVRQEGGRKEVATVLSELLPKRLADFLVEEAKITGRVAELSREGACKLKAALQGWQVRPIGTEGYRTAEVTLGGVDTRALSSKTMEARDVPGLYFIGEVVDVTGWLGGYNFQWAWSSAVAAGQAV